MDQVPPLPAHRADWYPDPTGRFEYRYHNGVSWTGDVSVDGNRFLDPLRSAGAGPGAGLGPVPFRETSSSVKARAAFVLGLCSFLVGWVPFLCLLAAAAAVVGLVFSIGVLRRERHGQRGPSHGYAVAGAIFAPLGLVLSGVGVWLTVLTLREVQTFTDVGRYSTGEANCDVVDGLATYRSTITNESTSTRSYEVTVEFLRPGTSVRLYIDSVLVNDVEPGSTAPVVVTEVVTEPALACEILGVTGPLPFAQS